MSIKYLLGLLLIISLPSCATSFKPDYSLIQNYSFELQKKEPFQPPYYSIFNKNGKQLFYVAANHTSKRESKTFKIITKAFDEFQPDFVIVEGIQSGEVSKGLIKYVKKCFSSQSQRCEEQVFVIFNALEKNIPFEGGEPSDLQILESAKLQGLTSEDIVYFYLLRISIQWKRQKKINEANAKKMLSDFTPVLEKNFKNKVSINYDGFLNWYSKNSQKSFKIKDLKNNDVAPISNGTFFQQISHKEGITREKNLLSRVANALNKHNRVLIVYGGGHFVISKLVIEDMLGKAKTVSDSL